MDYITYLKSLTPEDLEDLDRDPSPEAVQVINDYLDYTENYSPLE